MFVESQLEALNTASAHLNVLIETGVVLFYAITLHASSAPMLSMLALSRCSPCLLCADVLNSFFASLFGMAVLQLGMQCL